VEQESGENEQTSDFEMNGKYKAVGIVFCNLHIAHMEFDEFARVQDDVRTDGLYRATDAGTPGGNMKKSKNCLEVSRKTWTHIIGLVRSDRRGAWIAAKIDVETTLSY
jgi:hypothetical protein